MQLDNALPAGMHITQRNLYLYFLNHRKKNPQAPCFVPKLPMQSSRLPEYINAINGLEEKKLLRVDRSAPNYTGWILLDPLPNPKRI